MFENLRRVKPEIHRVGQDPIPPDRRFHIVTQTLPAKEVVNTKGNMDLLNLYSKGALKWEDTGRTCGNCVNFYYDAQSRYGGRCKARGFMTTHEDTPADTTYNWTHPVEQVVFKEWPACPLFTAKERLSRR